ncbi:hypothetical protein F5Y07DRAFT_270692 [Xylaria sp. FL0933]|nr:hypothetical protein F5Y07DRAFT_270692 [Xylaria sp. FL0933]
MSHHHRHHHHKERQYSVSSADSYQSYESSIFSYPSTSSTVISRPDERLAQYAPGGGDLPCEFVGYGHCDLIFSIDEVEEWIEHIIDEHLGGMLPRKAVCWFCDRFTFDPRQTRQMNFRERMWHIRDHLYDGTKTVNDIRPDHHLNKHLRDCGLIDEHLYNSVRRWSEVPQGSWILPHDAMPAELQSRDPRGGFAYSDPHAEERSYRRHKDKSGKNRK